MNIKKYNAIIFALCLGVVVGIGFTMKSDLFQSGQAKELVDIKKKSYTPAIGLEEQTIKVAETIGKSVVSISTEVTTKLGSRFSRPFGRFDDDAFSEFFKEFFGNLPEREFKRQGLGSGVIIDENGYILTNEHVVSKAEEIKVGLSDGREFTAELIGGDVRSDLAVIKIDAKNLPAADLTGKSDLKIGQWVLAIGNPFGFAIGGSEPTVTSGVVSAVHRNLPAMGRRDRNYSGLIQTDAAINPGNSGGPLVNLRGEVIGINVAIMTTTGGYQGVGFAIPVSSKKRIINKLVKGEEIDYGWLGVSIQDIDEQLKDYFGLKKEKGVIVVDVFEGSPAENAGLKEGDLIISLDGKGIATVRELVDMVGRKAPGSSVNLTVLRKDKKMQKTVVLGKRPSDIGKLVSGAGVGSFRGMEVENITKEQIRRFNLGEDSGVVVVSVEDDSPADETGIRPSDIILSIESEPVEDMQDFQAIIKKVEGDCLVRTNRGFFVLGKE